MRYIRKKYKNKYSGLVIDDASAKALAYIKNRLDKGIEFSDESLDYLLEDLSYIANKYIEKSFEIYNDGSKQMQDEKKEGILYICHKYMVLNDKSNANDVLLKQSDLENPTRKTAPRGEMLSNIMYLSNVVAHILVENKRNPESRKNLQEENISINKSISALYDLKHNCIKEIIKCKENGENIEVFFRTDERGRTTFSTIIPRYFEPFSIHLGDYEEIDEDTIEKYRPKNIDMLTNYKTIYPFKVTAEKEEALKYIYDNKKDTSLKNLQPRLKWYFDAKERLKNEKNQDKSEIINNIKEIENLIKEEKVKFEKLKQDSKELLAIKNEKQTQINERKKEQKKDLER